MKKMALSVMLLAALMSACATATPPASPTRSAVRTSPAPSETATPTPFVPLSGCSNTASALRLRKEPSTQTEIIAGIPPASCFPVYGYNVDHTWVWISFEGNHGWASAQYVSIQGEASELPVIEFRRGSGHIRNTASDPGCGSRVQSLTHCKQDLGAICNNCPQDDSYGHRNANSEPPTLFKHILPRV